LEDVLRYQYFTQNNGEILVIMSKESYTFFIKNYFNKGLFKGYLKKPYNKNVLDEAFNIQYFIDVILQIM